MPFDGTSFRYRVADVFDEMLEFYGPTGERWTQSSWVDGEGRRCLDGALKLCCSKLRIGKRRARRRLRAAIRQHEGARRLSIILWNDEKRRTFKDIQAVLLIARGE